jgi:hypothetical protein
MVNILENLPLFENTKETLNNFNAPVWVKKGNYSIGLDQYYTKPEIASICYNNLLKYLKEKNINIDDYIFLEPSAGNGAFSSLLPKKSLALDIMPNKEGIIKQDFFKFKPEKNKKYIVIGNPPFGIRGWLALEFINFASSFADIVAFILPMYFNSEGKGSAKYRVKNLQIDCTENLAPDIFITPEGKDVKINTVWQIWSKLENKNSQKIKPHLIKNIASDFVEIYTVCTYPKRRCGLAKMQFYDCFLASTFYKETQVVKHFSDVKYASGYGFIIKQKKEEIIDWLNKTNWNDYNSRATNHSKHIGKTHIIKRLIDGGFVNKQI